MKTTAGGFKITNSLSLPRHLIKQELIANPVSKMLSNEQSCHQQNHEWQWSVFFFIASKQKKIVAESAQNCQAGLACILYRG